MDRSNFNLEELEKAQQLEQMKKDILTRILTKEAFERLSRVKIANPQLAAQVEVYLLQIYQTGKLQGVKITDDKLKEVLKTLVSNKHDFNIRRI